MDTDEQHTVKRAGWRGWRVLALVGGVLLALAVTSFTAGAALFTFLFGTCAIFDDTGDAYPVNDSPQGQVCGQASDATRLDDLAAWSFPAAAAIALVLLVVAWRRGGTGPRSAAVAGLVALPLLAAFALSLPPDTCTDEMKQRPRADCDHRR